MSEYWKSTPKYLCKYCDAYVRDTKLDRTNHEATAKHQSALKRFLRNLHRGAENEERDKERARREIDRLNGVVPPLGRPPSSAAVPTGTAGGSLAAPAGLGLLHQRKSAYDKPEAPASVTAAERKAQMEQLAGLGVAIPQQFRGDLAMAGEWTTTAERVIRRKVGGDDHRGVDEAGGDRGRKRESEEQSEHDEAVQGLFKRPKVGGGWGRDSKRLDKSEEEGLDELLGSVVGNKEARKDAKKGVKKEEEEPDVKEEEHAKKEEEEEGLDNVLAATSRFVKPDPEEENKVSLEAIPAGTDAAADTGSGNAPAVVFKKRKPKNIRQK